jgi:hypothetical protein
VWLTLELDFTLLRRNKEVAVGTIKRDRLALGKIRKYIVKRRPGYGNSALLFDSTSAGISISIPRLRLVERNLSIFFSAVRSIEFKTGNVRFLPVTLSV